MLDTWLKPSSTSQVNTVCVSGGSGGGGGSEFKNHIDTSQASSYSSSISRRKAEFNACQVGSTAVLQVKKI